MKEDSKPPQAIRHTNHQNPLVIIVNGVLSSIKRNVNLNDRADSCPAFQVPERSKQLNLSCHNRFRQKVKAVINLITKRFSRSIKGLKTLSKAKIKKSPMRIRVIL